MVRVGRCLASCCPSYREGVHTEEGPRKEGLLKEEALKAERQLRERLEAESLQEAPLEAGRRQEEEPLHTQ
jgi:hypothetical protein